MLFDHKYYNGPDQTFDFDVVSLAFDNGSLPASEYPQKLVISIGLYLQNDRYLYGNLR